MAGQNFGAIDVDGSLNDAGTANGNVVIAAWALSGPGERVIGADLVRPVSTVGSKGRCNTSRPKRFRFMRSSLKQSAKE